MNKLKILFAAMTIFGFGYSSSYALGPIDSEFGVAIWVNDFDADSSENDTDSESLFAFGEGWLGDKWGIRGAIIDSDIDGFEFSDQRRLQLEIRRRLLSISDNNFVAVGVGMERADFENGSEGDGIRLSAEARLGIPGPFYFYGKLAWVPDYGSAGNFDDISATEIDLGLHIAPLPFISLRAGYLEYELDYDVVGRNLGSNTSGYYLGAGIHW